jgi:hypothetical protein
MWNALAKASFTNVTAKGRPIPVHFNPVSMQYSITNTLEKKGSGNKTKQAVSQSTAKLTLELTFDSTDTGKDVRDATGPIAHFMEPAKDKTPPVVLFSWGNFQFQGMLESYKETLDFFSPEGVPLRALVSIGMAAQDQIFDDKHEQSADVNPPDDSALADGADPARAARDAGDPRAARGIAAANGEASLRFGASAQLEVSASIAIAPAAGFATGASAGFGVGGGIGAGIGAGADIGIGFGASAGSGAGIAFDGASSLAPFGELHAPKPVQFKLDPLALLPAPESTGLATDAGAGFSITGAATPGVASFSAKV